MLCQLLSGLSALHAKNLVHRDLKPENLLIHDDKIVISDFGSVRRLNETTGNTPVSKHSILYRPQESFGDFGHYNISSDIYQTGLIGYLLFGGKINNNLLSYLNSSEEKKFNKIRKTMEPYDVSKFIDECIAKRVQAGKLIEWTKLPVYVPSKIKRVLKKATSDSKSRYTNVSEFLCELTRVCLQLPNWMSSKEGYTLRDWKGIDYFLFAERGVYRVKKKKNSSSKFIKDNRFIGSSYKEIYGKLKYGIKLP